MSEQTEQQKKHGDILCSDDDRSVVANTYVEALDLWEEHEGERPEYVEPWIGVPVVVTQELIDSNEFGMDSEIGDIWYWGASGDAERPLKDHEIRCWT